MRRLGCLVTAGAFLLLGAVIVASGGSLILAALGGVLAVGACACMRWAP